MMADSAKKTNDKDPLVLTQIAGRLHDIFEGMIDISDAANKRSDDKEQLFRTRSFMALFLLHEMRISPPDAAASVTDGGADGGIDLVYVDSSNSRIYFGQSKWRSNMKKGIELQDFTRFRDGVRQVLKLKWNNDNKKLHKFKNQIEAQLKNIDTNVVMVLAHTSEQNIAENIQLHIEECLEEENKFTTDFVSFKQFRVPQATAIARSYTRPENISLSVMLAHWGMLSEPYKAVYGSVSALDVVKWYEDHENRLFAENLRFAIDHSDVNEGIIRTAGTEPGNFWYFNNGITAICDSFDKQPIGGADTQSGVFDVKRISVINGAQTISSLYKAKQNGSDLSRIRVHLRIISLASTPEGFSAAVTSANNTQNDLNPVDFVAVDPNQERIRKEAAQFGIVYAFRRGDQDPDRATGFNIRTATIASACASGDLRLAVSAKRYISSLWENTKRDPYTRLFNAETSARYLWNAVKILHAVDEALISEGENLSGREKLTSVHANRFILYYVFTKLDHQVLRESDEISDILKLSSSLALKCLGELNEQIAENFPDAYPGNIFKNQERQNELLNLLEDAS